MIAPLANALRLTALAAAGAVYLGLGFWASASDHPPLVAVLVGTLPFVAGIVAACWHSRWRYPVLAACALVLALFVGNYRLLMSHVSWLYFAQHAGAMASLAVMFGSTLGTTEGALCSRIARIAVPGPLDAHYLRYTWKVTLAWTLYFVVCGLVSVGLFALAPHAVWAFFATLLTPVSLGAMFAGEYLIRLRALPGQPHMSIAQTIQSYRQYSQGRKRTA